MQIWPQSFDFPNQAPEPGTELLDPDHPVTRNLHLCALLNRGPGANFSDLSIFGRAGNLQTGVAGASAWKPSYVGSSFDFGAGATEVRFANPSTFPAQGTDVITIVALVKHTSGNGAICARGMTNDSNDALVFGVNSSNVLTWWDTVGSATITSLSVAAGKWTVVAVSQKSATSRLFATFDFNKVVTSSNSTNITVATISAGNPWTIGRCYLNAAVSSADDFIGQIGFVFVFKEAFIKDQLIGLVTDPFAMFMPPTPRRIYAPPASAGGRWDLINGGLAAPLLINGGLAAA